MNQALIEKAKRDPQAFGEIYELLYEEVYKYIYFRVKSEEIAEDLVSLIWEKVLQNLQKLESNHPTVFKVWLFRIARNTLYEHYRQKDKEVTVTLNEIEIVDQENIVENAKNKELNSYLIDLMQRIPENQREMVSLKFFSGFKNKEIAEIMDLSEQIIAAYLSRALKNLRSKIKLLL